MAAKSFIAPIDSSERILADGRIAQPGEPIDLDSDAQDDEFNARLIEEGHLLEVESSGGKPSSGKPKASSNQTEDGGE